MTARDIQRRLIYDLHRRNFVVPNFTPSGWFECDVFEITKAGFFREYEIKLSRSDFFADADKYRRDYDWTTKVQTTTNKHDQMLGGWVKAPCRFYFVTPVDLVKIEDVPAWAGLIHCWPYPHSDEKQHIALRLNLRIVRQAPVLHRCKIDPAVRQQALENCYYRYHNLLGEMDRQLSGGG